MKLLQLRLYSNLYKGGLICLVISLGLFCIPFFRDVAEKGGRFALFALSFLITWGYFISMAANRWSVPDEEKIYNTFLFLILFFISAWALNRQMTIFEEIPGWFAGLLVLLCLNYIGLGFAKGLPGWVVHGMSFIAGTGLVTFTYLSFYLLPVYPLGVVGFFLFGVSLHIFVPLLFLIYTFPLLGRLKEINKRYTVSFIAGLLTVVLFIACYTVLWNQARKEIDKAWAQSEKQQDIPQWVGAAQRLRPSFFIKRVLKRELVYSTPESVSESFSWFSSVNRFNEPRKHDPLVMTAAFFTGKTKLDKENRLRVLQSLYGVRHESEQRLWSGDHLFTRQVNTEVKLWPACNIGYTEKTVTVANKNSSGFRRPEEAIYSFSLPEGGVVTSLSLWINGHEEKGVMTTKGKADSSYKRIVGVESRDPSLVHWQEGNTVSVRVFPVIAGNSRKFRIGITAPLQRVKGKLRYENIYFKGPAFDKAEENIQFDFEQPAEHFQLPASFTSMSAQSYKRRGEYVSRWSMEIDEPRLNDCSFNFDKTTYSLAPYHKRLSSTAFEKIYLDINHAWTRKEFNTVTQLLKGKDVFVYDATIKKLSDNNKEAVWTSLHEKQFSLFPLFTIPDPAQSLIITKNEADSPGINDLAGTTFMQKTRTYLETAPRIKLFDLGSELSVYLKSLKEFRVFQYDKGDITALENLLAKSYFPDDLENDDQVIIHNADMVILRKQDAASCTGPDHLMRLFTYNHLMQQLGKGLLADHEAAERLVEEARKAYVVTPVSSLVVLESQADYDRFAIRDADISLKNASLGSKGAVPEPHEWVLIITSLMTLAYITMRKKLLFR